MNAPFKPLKPAACAVPSNGPAIARLPAIPPLENGDRLTRGEFERRYNAMPEVKKAELIEGEVFMASPVSHGFHGEPHTDLSWFFKHYTVFTPSLSLGDNSTVRIDTDNEPQPDLCLFVRPEFGGRVTVDAKGFISGPPELVAEISGSSVSIDRVKKFTVYQRYQVAEYVIWRVYDEAIDWFAYAGGRFEPLPVDADGVVRSRAFPGLWLDPAALLRRDLAAVLATLSRGVASPEHAAFVARLAAAQSPS